MMHKKCLLTSVFTQAMWNDWTTFEVVQVQCSHVASSLISKLEWGFPNQELMNAIGIIYPSCWLNLHVENIFRGHLVLLKAQFCFERFIGPKTNLMKILTLFNENKLDLLALLFKIAM